MAALIFLLSSKSKELSNCRKQKCKTVYFHLSWEVTYPRREINVKYTDVHSVCEPNECKHECHILCVRTVLYMAFKFTLTRSTTQIRNWYYTHGIKEGSPAASRTPRVHVGLPITTDLYFLRFFYLDQAEVIILAECLIMHARSERMT